MKFSARLVVLWLMFGIFAPLLVFGMFFVLRTEQKEEPGGEEHWVRIVFAGDLAGGGGCADRSTTNTCDLYEATVDIASGNVSELRQLASTPVSESYPVWNPNEEVVYATLFRSARTKDVGYVSVTDGQSGVLVANATWPAVSPDGTTFAYVAEGDEKMMIADFANEGLAVENVQELTGIAGEQDPDFSADGRFVVFHSNSSGEGEARVYDRETQQTVSYGVRSGHCAFGAMSNMTLCDSVSRGGLISRSVQDDGTLSEEVLLIADQTPTVLGKYDAELAGCAGTSFNYPTFCGDDEHVLVSVSCNMRQHVAFSRLMLVDLSGSVPAYYPVGKHLADAFAGMGNSTWTADCL